MTKKLDIIDLNLGFDPNDVTDKPKLSEKTKERVAGLITHEKIEQSAIRKHKESKQATEQQKAKAIETIFKQLSVLASNEGIAAKSMPIHEIIKTADTMDPSSVILRLNNYIKKKGLWQLKKSQIKGINHYYLVPSVSEPSSESIISEIRKTPPATTV